MNSLNLRDLDSYLPKGSRAESVHIGVEPMALWDDNSSWNIFEQEFVPIT